MNFEQKKKIFEKKFWKNFNIFIFAFFLVKNPKMEIHVFDAKTESWNSGNHEFWNHEMWESTAHTVILLDWTLKNWGLSNFAFQQC